VQGVDGFCLAIQPTDGDLGTIGRKFTYFLYKNIMIAPILDSGKKDILIINQ
jgi:hypothetical protein